MNELVKPDGFPLPRIQDCLWLDRSISVRLISLAAISRGGIPKSAFVCKYSHFEMTRMPFGLKNAASTFQRTMEMALQGLQWITCLIYRDDTIVFGKSFEEQMRRVEEVLERIKALSSNQRSVLCFKRRLYFWAMLFQVEA